MHSLLHKPCSFGIVRPHYSCNHSQKLFRSLFISSSLVFCFSVDWWAQDGKGAKIGFTLYVSFIKCSGAPELSVYSEYLSIDVYDILHWAKTYHVAPMQNIVAMRNKTAGLETLSSSHPSLPWTKTRYGQILVQKESKSFCLRGYLYSGSLKKARAFSHFLFTVMRGGDLFVRFWNGESIFKAVVLIISDGLRLQTPFPGLVLQS